MERLEEMAMAPLGLIDRFQQELRTILDERALPPDEMMNRINFLRENIRQECEGQGEAFDRETQGVEQDLVRRLEQLKEIRERGSVVWRTVEAMFRPS